MNEKNYHKSLDHRSFNFKQAEKKNLSSKGTPFNITVRSSSVFLTLTLGFGSLGAVLLAEIKQKYQEKLKHKPSEQPNYHLKYGMNDPQVLNDINDLITNAAERILSKADRERVRMSRLPLCARVVGGTLVLT